MGLPPIPPGLDPSLSAYLTRLHHTLDNPDLPFSLQLARRFGVNGPNALGANTGAVTETPPAPVLTSQSGVYGAMLFWTVSTDPSVKAYEIERDGESIGYVMATVFADPTLRPSIQPVYRVRAVRETGVVSAWSNAVAPTLGQIISGDLGENSVTTTAIRPGDVTLATLARDTGVEAGGFGMRLEGRFADVNAAAYVQLSLSGDMQYVVQAGDRLEYDILIPAASADSRAGLDLHRTGEGNVLLSMTNAKDTTGLSAHPGTRLSDRDRWIHRVIILPNDWTGLTIDSMAVAIDRPNPGISECIVKAMRIVAKDGVTHQYGLDRHTQSIFKPWPYVITQGASVTMVRETYGHVATTDNVVSAAITRGGQFLPADINITSAQTEIELGGLSVLRVTPADSIRVRLSVKLEASAAPTGTPGSVTATMRLWRCPSGGRDPNFTTKLYGASASVSWGAKTGNFNALPPEYQFNFVDLPTAPFPVGYTDYFITYLFTVTGAPPTFAAAFKNINLQLWDRSA